MRLVYQTAQRVIIWLGPSNSHIDSLFDWMNALDQQVLAIARPHTISTWENEWSWLVWNLRGQPPPDEIREALRVLLQREWFSRIWVLQEAALARSAMVICGWNEVNSRVFVVIPSLLNIHCGEGEQARLDILPGLLREKSWWAESSSKDLVTLLQKFKRSKASDPRDIIYALLGLSGDTHSSEFLRPNYQISVKETVQRSVAYFMLQRDCLLEGTPIRSLPSWGIDEFLEKLDDLPFYVFKWTMDHAQDALLYNLILSQKDILLAQSSHPYKDYRGVHGAPITIAMKKTNFPLIDLLLTIPGMDVESIDSEGRTPMRIAMDQGNIVLARLICDYRRQNIREQDCDQSTALSVPAKQGSSVHEELSREEPRFAIFERVFDNDTPLLIATKRGDRATVESILSQSVVDLGLPNWDANGDGPLNIAARRGDEQIIDLLLQTRYHSQVSLRGSDGLTPLESAIVGNFRGIIKKLLVYNRDTLYHAVMTSQCEVLHVILEADSTLLNYDWFLIQKPLACAAEAGKTEVVSLLLDKGAGINSRDFDPRAASPLWMAAARGHLDTVKVLVERGADLELTANEGPFKTTALWAAASNGYSHLQVVMYLLEAEAHVEQAPDGKSQRRLNECVGSEVVLWAAICGGHTGAVRTLVEGGVDLEVAGPLDFDQPIQPHSACINKLAKPIWIAALLGHADIVSLLIEHGADIEARDTHYGMTPFLIAAHQEMWETMQILHKSGANTSAKPCW